MTNHQLNEPAFPIRGGLHEHQFVGASLREYFAAKAMHALVTEPPWGDGGNATIHTWSAGFHGKDPLARFAYASYKMADAMLAMRESNADPSEREPSNSTTR